MAVRSDLGVRGPLAKLLEVDRRCVHLRPVFGDALEAIEVCGEQSLVGRSSPPRHALELAGLERRDLEEDVEPTGPIRPAPCLRPRCWVAPGVVGTSVDAKITHDEWDWTRPSALVLGGEGRGLHRLVAENCDVLVKIPMYGRIDSLNVSVAAGVILFEARRQRKSGERV